MYITKHPPAQIPQKTEFRHPPQRGINLYNLFTFVNSYIELMLN